MNFLRKKDEVLAALGNIRAMERLHVDTHTEEKIKNISGIKVAESKRGQFWIDFQELNGFLFMNSTILSHYDLTTSRGVILDLLTKEYEIIIDSDNKEVESDFSNVSNTWITQVSFVIEAKEREILENKNFEEIVYKIKNEKLRLFAVK